MSAKRKLSSYGRFAILLFVLGAIFGADSLCHLGFLYKLWPLLITILGIGFIGIFRARDRKEPLYLTLGTVLICFSGLALYCDFTSWSTLKYLWPLFLTFIGFSMILDYAACKKKSMWLLGGMFMISLSIVFFFVFSINADLWWTVFLLAGGSIWISERSR